MQNEEELELIALAQTGDEVAFQKLYNKYEKTVHYMAYRILNNHHDAQDATQAVFIQVHQSIKSLKCPEYFRLWINRIVTGKCNNIYRKKRVPVVDMDEPSNTNRLVENHRDHMPSKHMHFQSDKELVDHMIMELSYEQRQAIVLFYFQELSLNEIVEVTGEPLGTIKSRLHLAKKNLKRSIESYMSREGSPIDFNAISFDAFIATALVSGFQAFTLTSKGAISVGMLSKLKQFLMTGSGKVVATGILLTSTGVAASGAYQVIRNNLFSNEPLNQKNIVAESAVENEQDAYFTLLNWAPNAKVILQHDPQDIDQVINSYQILKEKKGIYWEELTKSDWIKSFEIFMQK